MTTYHDPGERSSDLRQAACGLWHGVYAERRSSAEVDCRSELAWPIGRLPVTFVTQVGGMRKKKGPAIRKPRKAVHSNFITAHIERSSDLFA